MSLNKMATQLENEQVKMSLQEGLHYPREDRAHTIRLQRVIVGGAGDTREPVVAFPETLNIIRNFV